ncbi:MAG TPA: hypothetical protein VFU31_11885 [Candidatus Binatia bacterium]|nr:hypothetical protein [Candidatus Binatia bacterium]
MGIGEERSGSVKMVKPLLVRRALFDPTDAELFQKVFGNRNRQQEEGLMLAVLQDAIEDFQKYVLANAEIEKTLFQEAETWILEKNSEWFFSFENICDTLQLQPDRIRQALLYWKERKICSRATRKRKLSGLLCRVGSIGPSQTVFARRRNEQ